MGLSSFVESSRKTLLYLFVFTCWDLIVMGLKGRKTSLAYGRLHVTGVRAVVLVRHQVRTMQCNHTLVAQLGSTDLVLIRRIFCI